MPEFTITHVEVIQRTYDVEDEQAAIKAFLAEPEVDDAVDLDRGFYVKAGRSYGEEWIDLAGDLAESDSYDNEQCDHPGCGKYLHAGECPDEDEQLGAHGEAS